MNKTIHIVWVGDEGKQPDAYIQTWRDLNPDWSVKVWGNREYAEYSWALRRQLDHRWERLNELNGVADIMRWEALYNEGGFGVDADGPCIKPLEDWLFTGTSMAVCYESEHAFPGRLATGYIYAEKKHPIIKSIIDGIQQQPQCDVLPAWRALATMRLTYEYHKRRPTDAELRIWPSHYFIPEHRLAPAYRGEGPVFARQMFMSTHSTYKSTGEYDANTDVYMFGKSASETPRSEEDLVSSQSQSRGDTSIDTAFALHQEGQSDKAETMYRGLLAVNGNDFNALQLLGILCSQRGDFNEADQLLKAARAVNDSAPQVHYNLGNLYLAHGDIAESRACYERTLELDGSFQEARQQIARMENTLQKPVENSECSTNAPTTSVSIKLKDSERRFNFREESVGDKGVIRQIFQNQDYNIMDWDQGKRLFSYHIQNSSKAPSLIVDAGANIGASAVYFSTIFSDSFIFTIEPDIANWNLLEKNTNGLNVFNFRGAISDVDGELSFEDPGRSDWGFMTRRVSEFDQRAKQIVKSISPSSILAHPVCKNTNPLILKVDIEGGEEALFCGDTSWLDKFPLIIIELHDWMLPFSGSSRNFLTAVAQLDFDFLHRGENIFLFNRRILNTQDADL